MRTRQILAALSLVSAAVATAPPAHAVTAFHATVSCSGQITSMTPWNTTLSIYGTGSGVCTYVDSSGRHEVGLKSIAMRSWTSCIPAYYMGLSVTIGGAAFEFFYMMSGVASDAASGPQLRAARNGSHAWIDDTDVSSVGGVATWNSAYYTSLTRCAGGSGTPIAPLGVYSFTGHYTPVDL